MMVQSLKSVKEYEGTLDCIRKVYKNEGITGFWKGAYTNAVRSIGSSFCLILYDELKKIT
jgi:solute carrier family 25 (adenine nucleotide translocator) protein 4/5/6/31